jgi:hypothetical protein
MTSTAVCFSELTPARTLRRHLSRWQWTAIGALVIVLAGVLSRCADSGTRTSI